MHPAERGSYVTLPARLSQWDFNYGPAIDGSIQMSDYQKDDRRQMNKRGISPRTILIFVPQGKIQKRGTDMDQNVNYYGIILLLRQLRESGSFSEKELRRVAARIAADSGADIMISL